MDDVLLVAQRTLDRWSLVEDLGLSPRAGTDRDAGLARIVHPAAHRTDVVLLVRDEADLAWLRRLRCTAVGRAARVVAVVAAVDPVLAARAGADAVVAGDGTTSLADEVRAALARARRVTLVVADTAPATTT